MGAGVERSGGIGGGGHRRNSRMPEIARLAGLSPYNPPGVAILFVAAGQCAGVSPTPPQKTKYEPPAAAFLSYHYSNGVIGSLPRTLCYKFDSYVSFGRHPSHILRPNMYLTPFPPPSSPPLPLFLPPPSPLDVAYVTYVVIINNSLHGVANSEM